MLQRSLWTAAFFRRRGHRFHGLGISVGCALFGVAQLRFGFGALGDHLTSLFELAAQLFVDVARCRFGLLQLSKAVGLFGLPAIVLFLQLAHRVGQSLGRIGLAFLFALDA